MRGKGRWVPVMVCFALVLALPAWGQEGYEFMPKGGKTLLLQVLGSPPDMAELSRIAATKHTEEEWSGALAAHKAALSDKELRTLAAYLAVNMPLAEGVLEAAVKAGKIGDALPPDGRELAWNQCQFCHSLFTGYLTQDRDLAAWQAEFQTPFHREITMTEQERETFSRYSAINMPMKIDDVPPELRF